LKFRAKPIFQEKAINKRETFMLDTET